MPESTENLNTAEKLNLETALIKWKDLQLFFAKGSLIQVAKPADLLEVATAIAEDKQMLIEELIAEKSIEFASPDWVNTYCQPETELWAVVVAPYVICQLNH